jgi:hypothetical protein
VVWGPQVHAAAEFTGGVPAVGRGMGVIRSMIPLELQVAVLTWDGAA